MAQYYNKKTQQPNLQVYAFLFRDLDRITHGFPLSYRVKIESPWLCHIFYFTRSLKSNAFQLLL
jgi:hypothetical protein